MTHLILGKGEVGKALSCFFDISEEPDIIHICFPFSKEFIEQVKAYQKEHSPRYTIIHSTVPVGTSRECGAIHSPIIGKHPFLEKSLGVFVKYLAGEQAGEVADEFRRVGMKVYLFDQPETTELMKLLDTTFYALCIEYTKEVKRLCGKYGVPFEAWTIWTYNYNKGYQELGFPEFTRPNLVPQMTKIGGHCLLPNCELLNSEFAELIKKLNK